MPTKFTPYYTNTAKITQCLARIEAAKEKVLHTPLTPTTLASLRETARLHTIHYSTKIAGNKLELKQIEKVLQHQASIPGYERDENEVKGYDAALKMVEQWANKKIKITEEHIKTLHALACQLTEKQTPYRDDQSILREDKTNYVIYIPPAAQHVPDLMQQFVQWINSTDLPCPLVAGIAHYQFVTIRPYYDGNGRTARLLTTLILLLKGYDLKGLCSLEEYYARNLKAYYEAFVIGQYNYSLGRADANIVKWIEYFIEGVAIASENVLTQMPQAITNMQSSFAQASDSAEASSDTSADKQEESSSDVADTSADKQDCKMLMRQLDLKQRKALSLFQTFEIVTANQIGSLFGIKPRTSSTLCKNWVEKGFLEMVNSSTKSRTYKLAKPYDTLVFDYRHKSTLSHIQHESAGFQQ